ncbi:MAG: hypothetical protein F3744_11950 [Nitrospinae bacterium]|nr:hypothetical protein [Nitrospinota bacterium]
MSIYRFSSLIFLCLIGTSLSSAWALTETEEILTQLDQSYYYPQQRGLSKLQVRVQWEQLDVATGSGKFLRNPDYIFTWRKVGGKGVGDFKIAEDSDHYSIKRKFELKNQIRNYGELIIPFTLKEKFSKYRGRLNQRERGRASLLLKAGSPDAAVRSYHLKINKKDMKIESIRFKQRSAPYKVSGRFRYDKLDGKWVIVESKSLFTMGELDYQETSTYRYKKFGKIWLVYRIDQILKQDSRIFQSHRFTITDVRSTF